jgi:predicted enzyme related to lactoylglutathione lyase
MNRAFKFYTEVLDFTARVAPHPDPAHFMSGYAALERDGSIMHLSSHGADTAVFGTLVYVRVPNVDELCARFVANGVTLTNPIGGTEPVDQTWGMREIGFKDPDGNSLTFGQPLG